MAVSFTRGLLWKHEVIAEIFVTVPGTMHFFCLIMSLINHSLWWSGVSLVSGIKIFDKNLTFFSPKGTESAPILVLQDLFSRVHVKHLCSQRAFFN